MMVLLGVGVMTKLFLRKAVPDEDWLVRAALGGLLMMLAAVGLAAVTVLRAVALARRSGIKLWLHPSVGVCRRNRVWPPGADGGRLENQLGLVLTSVGLLLFLTPTFFVLVAWLRVPPRVYGVALAGIHPAMWLWARGQRPVVADSAAECWPPDEVAAAGDPVQ
jgi:hypothetical protein